jgi:hypothetical protein
MITDDSRAKDDGFIDEAQREEVAGCHFDK